MQVEKNIHRYGQGWLNQHPNHLDSEDTLVLFFADKVYYEHEAIRELTHAFPHSQIVGCSTAGEIYHDEIFDKTLVYVVLKMENTKVRVFSEILSNHQDLRACGKSFANQLYTYDLNNILLFTSGLNVNIDEFIDGFKNNAGREIPIFGGIAGDGERFQETWSYYQQFSNNMMVAIALYGENLKVEQGCEGGWTKFGLERKITRSVNNILYEIDGQPALQMYKKYLGDLAEKLPSSALLFPLSIRKDLSSQFVVRTILTVDESTNSIVFAGDIPQGWLTCLMRCSKEGLIHGAQHAAEMSTKVNKNPEVAIIVSCVGRRMVLGQSAFNEIAAVSNLIKHDNSVNIGFYSYGEIATLPGIDTRLHNQTMTIATLSEH